MVVSLAFVLGSFLVAALFLALLTLVDIYRALTELSREMASITAQLQQIAKELARSW